ncbi:MAG: hypothetical protein MZV70_51295 [Desulfobacterales bacterium]|nr:hypothetical protein [Desulfobacterales bacterium]
MQKEAQSTVMKRKISLALVLLMAFISCEGPETTVTNIIGRNGSVLRKAEMSHTSSGIKLTIADFNVPVDSTWNLKDSHRHLCWKATRRGSCFAEKLFGSADAINEAYLSDTGTNSPAIQNRCFQTEIQMVHNNLVFRRKM